MNLPAKLANYPEKWSVKIVRQFESCYPVYFNKVLSLFNKDFTTIVRIFRFHPHRWNHFKKIVKALAHWHHNMLVMHSRASGSRSRIISDESMKDFIYRMLDGKEPNYYTSVYMSRTEWLYWGKEWGIWLDEELTKCY